MEGGKTANYWPGFVDALTNVVIAMVFVIVVLAIALSFAAQLMGKRIAAETIKKYEAAASANANGSTTVASPKPAAPPVPDAGPPPSTLPARTTIAVQGNESAASAAGGRVRANANLLQLDFADTALTLDETAVQKLREALAPARPQAGQARVQVVAVGPALQLSENQRAAYIRVMAIRNELLDQGYAADHIAVRIDTASTAPRSSVTISITAP